MSATVGVSAIGQSATGKVKRFIYPYLFMGSFFTFLDRTNIGFAQLEMGKELGLTATAFGFAAGVFFISYCLLEIPANALMEKFGTRRWMTTIMCLWGLTSALSGFVHDDVQLYIVRFILGVFEAGSFPGMILLINYWFRGRSMGAATSILLIGGGIAGSLGAPFAGWALGFSFMGLAGWRWLFIIEGALTLIWALITLAFIADGPSKANWLNEEEKEWLQTTLEEDRGAEPSRDHSLKLGESLMQPKILIFFLSYFLFGFTYWIMTFFMPTLIKAVGQGMDNQTVGLVALIPALLQFFTLLYWGRHADAHNERHWHIVLPIILATIGFACLPAATTPILAVLCICAVVMGNNGYQVNFWPAANMLVGKKAIATGTALINMGAGLGGFLGPYFLGWTKDMTGNYNLGMIVCMVMLLVNVAIMQLFFMRLEASQRQIQKTA